MNQKEKIIALYHHMNNSIGVDIAKYTRKNMYVIARCAFCVAAKQVGFPYDGIGEILGGRTHATILNAVEQEASYSRDHFYMVCDKIIKEFMATLTTSEANEDASFIQSLVEEQNKLELRLSAIKSTIKAYYDERRDVSKQTRNNYDLRV